MEGRAVEHGHLHMVPAGMNVTAVFGFGVGKGVHVGYKNYPALFRIFSVTRQETGKIFEFPNSESQLSESLGKKFMRIKFHKTRFRVFPKPFSQPADIHQVIPY